jgi:hypothetical protein
MKQFHFVFIAFLLQGILYAQENIFSTESFIIKLTGANLEAENPERTIVFQRSFNHPAGEVIDLDNDNNVEFLVNDYIISGGRKYFYTYVYNTLDTFYLVDSICSGLKKPYHTYSNELNEVILVTGSPDFDELNTTEMVEVFSPLVCWGFLGVEFGIVNDRLYDIFLNENEKNIDLLDSLYRIKKKNCTTSTLIRPIIAAIFINYLHADEKAMAEKSFSQYYNCDDKEKFKATINNYLR